MRRLDNPPNPYASRYCDWLEPPPEAAVEVYLDESRSILSKNESPDIPFRWSVNPYRGCQHACAYCYARPTHEYLEWGAGTDFETRLIVKPHAPELLAEALSRKSWRREMICFSGVTDCYQPLEAVWGLTRRCLEACAEHRTPVGIVTKSYLVVRDIDVLCRVRDASAATVYCSIAFAEDRLARKIEPHAPSPTRRFEAMKRISDAGIRVGVMVAPIIPALNDRQIPEILERAAENGAAAATSTLLRLPGSVQEVFLSRLRAAVPDAAKRVESRIRALRGGGLNDPRFGSRFRGKGAYWEGVMKLFSMTARRLGLTPDDNVADMFEECAEQRGSSRGVKPPASVSSPGKGGVSEEDASTGSASRQRRKGATGRESPFRQLPLFGTG